MKYSNSSKKGIEVLINYVLIDLKKLQINTIQTIEMEFIVNRFFEISNLINLINKIYDFVGNRDIEIIFETEIDESIADNEFYLKTKYSKILQYKIGDSSNE